MDIEINKDIEKYQESIAMGLSVKQFIYSMLSLVTGATLILLLYPYVGLTMSGYIAIPVVAPLALGGFYTYNNMGFYEVMYRKLYMTFLNKTLLYVSTESEGEMRKILMEEMAKSKGRKNKKRRL